MGDKVLMMRRLTDGESKMSAKGIIRAITIPIVFCSGIIYADSVISTEQIEADWLQQHKLRTPGLLNPAGKLTVELDAAGGCDGVINGQWGFHTENENNPWWQVDIENHVQLDRIILYNRTELAQRNSRIIILLSDDGKNFRKIYQHKGTQFLGFADKIPLTVKLKNAKARFVRLQLPNKSYFHLDEVEIYTKGSKENIALNKPAIQSSLSQWSQVHASGTVVFPTKLIVDQGMKLAERLNDLGVDVYGDIEKLNCISERVRNITQITSSQDQQGLYLEARTAIRQMSLKNPLLDFDDILFVKRAPGIFPHMSDQYYGWWSRPGGGIFILKDFKSESPQIKCLTEDWPPGNFLRPELSYDGKKVLFAYCKYYPHVADMEKVEKQKLPEDAFYAVYEMNIDGTGCRQLTRGRYDDFDARYLPNDNIVFLSTRKGTSLQVGQASAQATYNATLPDSYVRCGGDNKRPCAVFTLHTMDANGDNLRAISPFENFEWTPAVTHDGRIIYARWDYIDRFNGHFMSLWSTNQDGTNPQLVYGNYTKKPQCIFEARAIPNSNKLVFTAAAHHSNMGGSLVLLDRSKGSEFETPLTRLTPEVPFPETEEFKNMYYANPWPLSEEFFLVAWSDKRLPPHCRIENEQNPANATGIYIYDAFGNLELLHRDPEISSMYPIPVRPGIKPAMQPSTVDWDGPQLGRFLVQDIYHGLKGIERGSVKRLRIIGVPPKVQPHMNKPNLGVSKEDPGKFILGTVPVEKDGSAYFYVPSGISVFFQALDADGFAIQTMRSLTYVQPNQTLSCIGCHEPRDMAPLVSDKPIAMLREPSKITPAPAGSWPLRFDKLVGPVLEKACISCHNPKSKEKDASPLDLTPAKAYDSLISFAEKNLEKLAFEKDKSEIGDCAAKNSRLMAIISTENRHFGIKLTQEDFSRIVTWMDVYAHRQGSFSIEQEVQLAKFKTEMAAILNE